MNTEFNCEAQQSSCNITVEFIDSFTHPELSELYDKIDTIQNINDEDAKSFQKRESIQSDISLGSDYIEINNNLPVSRANQSWMVFERHSKNTTMRYLPGKEKEMECNGMM